MRSNLSRRSLRPTDRLFLPADDFIYNDVIWEIYGSWPRETGFKEAGDLLVDDALERDDAVEFLMYPAAFCYRHYVELLLKSSLVVATSNGAANADEKALGQHDLLVLWNRLRKHIKGNWPNADRDLPIVDSLLRELNAADSRADAFRFAANRAGQTSLPGHVRQIRLDLENLREVVTALGTVLEDWRGRLSAAHRTPDPTSEPDV